MRTHWAESLPLIFPPALKIVSYPPKSWSITCLLSCFLLPESHDSQKRSSSKVSLTFSISSLMEDISESFAIFPHREMLLSVSTTNALLESRNERLRDKNIR